LGEHLVITGLPGTGKTVAVMLAALRAILADGRKASWLVPQRSLTDELDRELEVCLCGMLNWWCQRIRCSCVLQLM